MFTYVIEPGNGKDYIWVYEGERQYKTKGMLYFTEEKNLIEALKVHEKSAVAIIDDKNKNLMKEGKRLAEKLKLEFQHP